MGRQNCLTSFFLSYGSHEKWGVTRLIPLCLESFFYDFN